MALNNCTITSQSFTKTGGQAIGSDNATLIISPNAGYVVSASDFTNNTGSLNGISSITLTDTGTAGAVNNTVRVTVDLDDTYVMPSANTTLTIDIDGDAELITYSLDGDYNTVESGTTTTSGSTAYSATGNYEQEVVVFSKTFTAATDKYFAEPPSYSITTGVSSNYSVTVQDTTNSDGYLTIRVFTIKYTFPNNNVSDDVIDFKATAVDIPNVDAEITGYYIDTANLPSSGENRLMQIFGGQGANFAVTVVDSGATSVASVSSQAIPSSGIYDFNIPFPQSSTNETYTITISGDLSSDFDTANGLDSSFDIEQLARVELTFEITTTDTAITTPSDNVKEFDPNVVEFEGYLNGEYTYKVHFDVTSTSNIHLTNGTIDNTSFNNQDDDDLDFYIQSFTLTGNGTTDVDVDFKVYVRGTTDQNLTSTLDLDDFLNTAPTDISLSSTSIDENNSVNDIIGAFTTTDSDSGDTHTYTLVSGTGSTDNASFNINGANLRAGVVFDYETKSSYSIRVRSTDAQGAYYEEAFTITINNVIETTNSYKVQKFDSNGATATYYYINPTQYCSSGILAVTACDYSTLTNKFINIKETNCNGNDHIAKIIGASEVSVNAYHADQKNYSSYSDADTDTNGLTCS